jgi:IS30 family transposase
VSKPERIVNLMNRYHHFTTKERECLLVLKSAGKNQEEIARALGKSPSTISRELRRNRLNDNTYSPSEADKLYRQRRTHCGPKKRLDRDRDLLKKVHTLLVYKYWSPEQIVHRIRKEEPEKIIGVSTIYRAIKNGPLSKTMISCLRIKSKRLGKTKGEHRQSFIHQKIRDRPKEANERVECGHFECDTVVVKKKGYIFTSVDRKSRLLIASVSKSKDSQAFNSAITEAFRQAGIAPKTFTCDRGTEFSAHDELKQLLKVEVYFANAHAPWERGTNENTNGLLRQFYPKHSSLYGLDTETLGEVVNLINLRPRKCLNWETPLEVFFDQKLHLT